MEVSWIKLSIKLFENRKIKQIRKLPEGDVVIGIWIQILCLAGNLNNGGLILFADDAPYTEDLLAVEFERSINVIRLALLKFEEYGMINLVNDVICVSNWEKYQSEARLEALREYNRKMQREYRSNQKKKAMSMTCQLCQGTDNISTSSSKSIVNEGLFEEYSNGDFELLSALKAYEEMRRKKKKPLTDRARKSALTKLDTLSKDMTEKIQIIDKSILHCWDEFYPLTVDNVKKQDENREEIKYI